MIGQYWHEPAGSKGISSLIALQIWGCWYSAHMGLQRDWLRIGKCCNERFDGPLRNSLLDHEFYTAPPRHRR